MLCQQRRMWRRHVEACRAKVEEGTCTTCLEALVPPRDFPSPAVQLWRAVALSQRAKAEQLEKGPQASMLGQHNLAD